MGNLSLIRQGEQGMLSDGKGSSKRKIRIKRLD